MSKKHNHVHKYKRIEWGKNKTIVWRCLLPGCSHYIHDEMIRNRKSICWGCSAVFTMNPDKMRRVKPKCDACQHKGDPILGRLDSLLENL